MKSYERATDYIACKLRVLGYDNFSIGQSERDAAILLNGYADRFERLEP